ncbi:MAG: phosphoribosyltransferase [Patescibacteria group bacterium]
MNALQELQRYFLEVAYLKDPVNDPDYIVATQINKEPAAQVLGWLYQIWVEKYAGIKVDAILPVPDAAKKFAKTFQQASGIPRILSTRKLQEGESIPQDAVCYQTESFTHGKKPAVSIIEGLTENMSVAILDDVVDDASTFLALMEALRNSGMKIQVNLMTVIFSKHHNKGGEKVEASGVPFFSAIPVVIQSGVMHLVA